MKKSFFVDRFIAHRGASGIAPENTIASISKAKQNGSSWVEIDVRLSKDDKLVVFHDSSLNRIANINNLVKDCCLIDLKKIDVGSWFDIKFRNEKIPTLLEVIKYCEENKMNLNIEIKTDSVCSKFVATKVQEILNKCRNSKIHFIVSSFDLVCMGLIKERKNLVKMPLIEEIKYLDNLDLQLQGYNYIGLSFKYINNQLVKKLINIDKKIIVYTVNDYRVAKEMFALGINSVISDFPENVLKNLF